MVPEHVEVRLETPPAPVQDLDAIEQHPAFHHHATEKVAPDDLLMMGMMLYMEQGLALEWLTPKREEESDEEKKTL